jgi:hypothetical protein
MLQCHRRRSTVQSHVSIESVTPMRTDHTETPVNTRGSRAWIRVFVPSLMLVLVGFALGSVRPIVQQAVAPKPHAVPGHALIVDPNYAFVMNLWLNFQSIANLSNSLDESAGDLTSRAITYRYFRTRANRLSADIGQKGIEARSLAAPAELLGQFNEYVGATDELTESVNLLTRGLGPDAPNAALLAQSDARRLEAIQRMQAVGDQLVDRVWRRSS